MPPDKAVRVLVADDSQNDGALYLEFLSSRGYEVTLATDGEAAVAAALEGKFDVIILDLVLPGLDGLQVLSLLRSYAATAWVPVITITAQTGEHMRAAAVDAGADLALEKPYPPEELEEAIRVFVQRGQRRKKI